jgi:hypothetical protein
MSEEAVLWAAQVWAALLYGAGTSLHTNLRKAALVRPAQVTMKGTKF